MMAPEVYRRRAVGGKIALTADAPNWNDAVGGKLPLTQPSPPGKGAPPVDLDCGYLSMKADFVGERNQSVVAAALCPRTPKERTRIVPGKERRR